MLQLGTFSVNSAICCRFSLTIFVVIAIATIAILKTGLNQPLMREVLVKLDECEGRLSELLIDSATDESEANSPIKMTPQDDKGEVVYLSRTGEGQCDQSW